MAVARVELCWEVPQEDQRAIIEAVADALVSALEVPAGDPTVIGITRAARDVVRPVKVSGRYTIVTVTMFAGRTLATRRRLYRAIVERLTAQGVPPHDVLIILHEVPAENWGVDGGVPASEVDVAFRIDV